MTFVVREQGRYTLKVPEALLERLKALLHGNGGEHTDVQVAEYIWSNIGRYAPELDAYEQDFCDFKVSKGE
jgi:hypothetical protein